MSAFEATFTKDPTLLGGNPYAFDPESLHVRNHVGRLLVEREAFIDATTNPDISDGGKEFAVFQLSGTDEFSDIGRAIEGTVMQEDWVKSPEVTQRSSASFEHNSAFFVVVDVTDRDHPLAAASLSVADLLRGPSETVNSFIQDQLGKEDPLLLPPELHVTEKDLEDGLWDVMAVMALKKYRGSNASAWAYHGLYKASCEQGIHRWIANMTASEALTMDRLGIPFRLIPDTEEVFMELPGRAPKPLSFYDINVDDIRESMTAKIASIDAKYEGRPAATGAVYATMARIALDGITKPVRRPATV